MSLELSVPALFRVVGALLALAAFLWVVRLGVRWLPLRRSGRRTLLRLLPALEASAIVAASLWIVLVGLGASTTVVGGALILLAVTMAWSARGVLSDVADGFVVRGELGLEPDQVVRVGNVSGRLTRTGLRSIEVETEDGESVRIPYGLLARAPVHTAPPEGLERAHTFVLETRRSEDLPGVVTAIRTAALTSPWSAVRKTPRIQLLREDPESLRFRVTVYPVDGAYAVEVEREVRNALGPRGDVPAGRDGGEDARRAEPAPEA